MNADNEETYEAEALRLGFKPVGDGTWARGRGRNYERKTNAKEAVEFARDEEFNSPSEGGDA